jgi:predicted GH43/DUF377 family glycosyl hydrolase
LLTVKKEGIILRKTHHRFENDGVLNPACYQDGNKVHMFYRAVRKGNHSTIGYCQLDGPLKVIKRNKKPLLTPEHNIETHNIEDARIVKIADTFYLTYTAYNFSYTCGALATSKDLKKFTNQGYITPKFSYKEFTGLALKNPNINPKYFRFYEFYKLPMEMDKKLIVWDKDVVFFPKKIGGNFVFLHRIRPEIQIVSFKNLKEINKTFWIKYVKHFVKHIYLESKYHHESSYIGAGCPPIETKDGWLVIYHGVNDGPKGFIYNACAALFDSKNIRKEIGRLKKPLFSPEKRWEKNGVIRDVVFPTGTSLFDDRLYVYYGAADEYIAVASMNLSDLLKELKKKSNRS